ncbi:MAG: isoaspartyl peptidase/L-asparaginase, partial [Planctomycetes bacterium]|nr:isoaspartyl peptidase/L-asparaginase [Planctomycetota bacterium]
AIAVHGGAGTLRAERVEYPGRREYDAAVSRALRAGRTCLLDGGSAIEAVVAAVVVFEDHESFNAGRGAALCRDGQAELSASIMDGATGRAGAIVGATRVRNPIRAAEALLPHVHGLLFGRAADEYAEANGLELVARDYFVTEHRRAQWQRHRQRGDVVRDHSDEEDRRETVGAVALDARGHLAAATSTGGLVNQLSGRVGDTPIVGAGTWADSRIAISATGDGDAMARVVFARRVADLVELAGLAPIDAAHRALRETAAFGGDGGCVLVTADGRVAMPRNSKHMVRGTVSGAGPFRVAIADDEIELTDR